jgi:hypothetical protein
MLPGGRRLLVGTDILERHSSRSRCARDVLGRRLERAAGGAVRITTAGASGAVQRVRHNLRIDHGGRPVATLPVEKSTTSSTSSAAP